MVFQFIHPTKVGGTAVFDYYKIFIPIILNIFVIKKRVKIPNTVCPII